MADGLDRPRWRCREVPEPHGEPARRSRRGGSVTAREETTYLGRPAWHGVFTVRQQWGLDGEMPMAFRWDATVDQATGLLVAASCTVEANGKPLPWDQELHVTSLEVDPALDPGWQRPEAPGRKTVLVDDGTRFGTPEEVAQPSWPTLPLIPQWAPAGYRLTDVASAGAGTGPHVRRAAEPRRRGQAREGDAGQHESARTGSAADSAPSSSRSAPRPSARRSTASRTSSWMRATSRASPRCSPTTQVTARRSASRRRS